MAAPHYRHRYAIYWEDTDAGGVVYYANYLEIQERCRTDWLRALGIDQVMAAHGAQSAVRGGQRVGGFLRPAVWRPIPISSLADKRAVLAGRSLLCEQVLSGSGGGVSACGRQVPAIAQTPRCAAQDRLLPL